MATDPAVSPPTSALIIIRALELFSKMGYAATSMREIAAAVGVTPPSIYNHYPAKEEILWEIVQGALADILAGQDRAFSEHSDSVNRLAAFVRFHTEFHARRSQAATVVNHNLSSLSRPHYRKAASLRARYERRLRDLLEAGTAEGAFAVDDLRITSFAILQMGMGIALWYRSNGDLPPDALADRYVNLALRMVAAEER